MPKITPYQLNLLTDGTVELYQELEQEIFKIVSRRLKAGKTDILEWQLDKMGQLHLLNQETIAELAKVSGKATDEIKRIIKKAGYAVVDDIDSYFEQSKPYPSTLDEQIVAYQNQTFRELNNFVNQTLISTNYGQGSVARMYTDIINKTTALYLTGTLTLNQAIQRTINQWVDRGLESAFIDKGGHTWSVERYVPTVLKSTMQRAYNDLRTARMQEYGIYTVLVSALPSAREACALCQGQVLDTRPDELATSGYKSVYQFGYGTPGGHRGINCRHQWFPFDPAVNVNHQPQYDPEEAVKNGKIEQGRKNIAARIRNTKKKLAVAEELGADNTDYYRKLLQKQQAQMRDYVKENNLKRNYRLEKVY